MNTAAAAPPATEPAAEPWTPADDVYAEITDAEVQAVWRDDMDRQDCVDVVHATRAAAKHAEAERARTQRHMENTCKCARGSRCRLGRREDAAALAAAAASADAEDERRWRVEDEAEEAEVEAAAALAWRGDLGEHGLVPKTMPAPPAAVADSAGRLLLAAGTVATVAAPPKAGKTWAALGLIRAVPKPGRVIWVAYERRGATARRAGPAGVPRKRVRILAGADASERRAAALESLAAVGTPGLVIIDSVTSSGCPTGGESVYPWWQAVVVPWLTDGTAVLLLDHTPRSDPRRALGSVTKAAFADVTFAVRAHREGNRLTRVVLEPVEFNDFGTHAEHGIVVDLADGVPTATAAVDAAVVHAAPTLTELDAFEAVGRGDLKKRAAADALGMPDTTFRRRHARWAAERATVPAGE